jgi:hypothetical protein
MPKSKKNSNRGTTSKLSRRLKAATAEKERSERLVGNSRQPKSLVQFFRESPLVGVDLDLERDRDTR